VSGVGANEVALEPSSARVPAQSLAPARERRELREAARGSREATEAVVRRYWPIAYRTAYLIVHDPGEAEEVAQEALLSALGAMRRFDRRRHFHPWLHRIVVNKALDSIRAYRGRPETVELGSQRDVAAPKGPPPVPPELGAALLELDPTDRAIVVLRHLFDYRAGEIGQMVGLSATGVRTRLQRALDRLRTTLEETQNEP
jgi:RNA polymerase sigma-70 factor (ECF subfamily)